MIVTKTKPTGVDILIQALQNFLYVQLQNTWGIGTSDYTSYGRVYRNQTEDGYSPEVYLGSNEYKDSFFDDTVKALSFFGIGETEKFNGGLISNVFLVFCVQIPLLKPTYSWRADVEVRMDVEMLCKSPRFGLMFQGTETGIDNVFKEFSGWKKKEGIKFRDMHPWHCFRLNFNTNPYPISIC